MTAHIFESDSDNRKFFTRFITVIAIILAYIFVASFLFNFIHNSISDPYCECSVPLTWTLVFLSTSGVVIGVAIYYYFLGSFQQNKRELKGELRATLKFLPKDERKILEVIVDSGGEKHQSKIVEDTGFNKAKVSRKISKLVNKKILEKEESGMSNLIKLEQPYKRLYIENNK